jgi:hypothetical protein
MNALHEYSLLVVVAAPVLAFVAANLALRLAAALGRDYPMADEAA